MSSRFSESVQRIAVASVVALCVLAITAALAGCHNHPNRSARLAPGDVNGDGVVDELDLEELEALLGIDPEPSEPFPVPCDVNGDGFFSFADILCLRLRLCERNRCGHHCRGDIPRPHPICEND